MKKLLLVLAIGATFAACNNGTSDKAAGADSTATTTPVDSTKPAAMDTTKHDSTHVAAPAKADSVKK